jgi:hypothetical protein
VTDDIERSALWQAIDEALNDAPVDHFVTVQAAEELIDHLVAKLLAAGFPATPVETTDWQAWASRWLDEVAKPGPIDPLAAMHDDADAITEAQRVLRAALGVTE